ncbi:hypothetical protein, partial [Pseudomonas aeruginosa]
MLSIPWAVVAFFVLSHAKYNPVAHELLKLLDCSSWLKSQQGEGPQLADSVEKVAASPCRWQNCSVSERGG